MKLRSRTITSNSTCENKPIIIETSLKKFTNQLKSLLTKFEKNPCSKSVKNLKYVWMIYTKLEEEFIGIYKHMERLAMLKYVLVSYKKTLQLMSEIIGKTYNKESIDYDEETKEMIVKILYKMFIVFLEFRGILYEQEDTYHMKELLKESEENAGKKIEDEKSPEALAYYCYSHLYGNNEVNRYEIKTYEDQEYSYEEIYDYYFGNNINKNPKDDLFIREDYERWFVYEGSISHYNEKGYKRYDELPPLYDYNELESRIDYHIDEIEKYKAMILKMYPNKS